jgi:hypothetical protein
MSRQPVARGRWVVFLPWASWAAFVVALALAIYLGMSEAREEPLKLTDALWAASFIGFPTTGALIASRLPDRPLGWLFLLAPLSIMSGVAFNEWANWGDTGGLARDWAAWLGNLSFGSGLAMFALIPFFLPGGNAPDGFWGRVLRVTWFLAGASVILTAVGPAMPNEYPSGRNPAAIEALGAVLHPIRITVQVAVIVALFLGAFSVVQRSWNARGVERQQSKWVALGAAIMVGSFLLIALVDVVVGTVPEVVSTSLTIVAILAFPSTIAIAMLRHRLFDIDIIINRALVYATLSALLIGAYLALVVAVQGILRPLTRESDIAVAASTLAVAAAFGPLRGRVQHFIDRRFYRHKYDSEQTLKGFSGKLRDEIDLETVAASTVAVVQVTVQPKHLSIWLRRDAG